MIVEHNLAGNIIYSLQEVEHFALVEKLLTRGIQVYDKYMEIYQRDNFSYFRTPYSMEPKSSGPGYQYEPEDRELKLEFGSYICNALGTKLNIDFTISDMWYLYQPNEDWIDNPPHEHLTADYSTTMYLEVNEGDHIIFYGTGNSNEKYYPNVGEILFFRGDVIHKPGISSGSRRISVNAELNAPYPGRFQ